MTHREVMQKLESLASHNPKDLAGMARFGINVDKAWVVSIPKLRKLAREIKKSVIPIERSEQRNPSGNTRILLRDPSSKVGMTMGAGMTAKALHKLALNVWDSGIHEAKILAGFFDDPGLVTEEQMEKWVLGFDSWDVTDMICGNLFDRTPLAVQKAIEWSERPEEFVKRAGFVLMAGLAVHDKQMPDQQFLDFLKIIEKESWDNRNFVRKAINWALRAIGKSRNERLYWAAMKACNEILDSSLRWNDEKRRAARFIAGDAIRELKKDYIKNRFGIK